MEEGASRIRRRVSVRKRTSPGLASACEAPTEAERAPGEDEAEEEKEEDAGAGGRRRKTAQPAEHYDSEEDMFGDYDSFTENSILAQVDDLEQKYMQLPEQGKNATDFATEDLCSESIKNKLSVIHVNDSTEYETGEQTENQTRLGDIHAEPGDEPLYDVPSSQALYFENLQNSSNGSGHQSTKEKDRSSCSHTNEELPDNQIKQPQPNNELSSEVQTSSERNRRKSIKDYLKSAMTGNAKAQTPVFSRNKQLKEALLSEEINVAKETIESSSDDLGPFYSLPSKVRDLYVQFKGIETLYGNAFG